MFKVFVFLLLLTIGFSSCQKLLNYYNHNEVEPSAGCQIKTITNESDVEVYTTRILYNTSGLPGAVEYETYNSEFDFTDFFTLYYVYDDLNRLVSETSDWVYGPDLVYYAYEGSSKLPSRDTVRALYSSWVEDLEYDAKGRIIQKTARDFEFVIPEDNPGPHPPVVHKYYYDLRGNRQEQTSNPHYPGIIQYTDNPSLYSTHPVWELIHKNYSKNSTSFGETFNEAGLPLTIKKSPVKNFQPFLNIFTGSRIEYDCNE